MTETALPRVLLAAPASGHGKTTLTVGLLAALRARGLEVAPFKVGPDYIDPGYHTLATGRPGRNLDPFLTSEDLLVPLLLHGARTPRPADVAVIEGVMGLFDGRLGSTTRGLGAYGSAAHIADVTRTPVILVVDISHASLSVGALVHGLATYDPAVRPVGVILNKVGSARHEAEVRRGIAAAGIPGPDGSRMPIPVLGALPRDAALHVPERHLGLVPAAERGEAFAGIATLAERVRDHVDLDAVLAAASAAPDLDGTPWDPKAQVAPPSGARPVVAVAGGRAFTFRYAETVELLDAAGCEPVVFDPMTDRALPAGTAGLYLGGGFPEVHAADLAANAALRDAVRDAVAAGVPTVAECAGMLYLARTLDGAPMAGALPATSAMGPRLTMGYREAVAAGDSLLTRAGEVVTGHEFHRTQTVLDADAGPVPLPGAGAGAAIDAKPAPAPAADAARPGSVIGPAWQLDAGPEGLAGPTCHAAYLHVHWAGHPHLAQRFADAVHAYSSEHINPGAPA